MNPSHRRHDIVRDQEGMALVELAFVSLILLGLLAAVFDLGFGWQSSLAVNEAARTGARVGSGQANSAGADYYALTGVKASLATAGKLAGVERVVVFRAAPGSRGRVPSSCLSATPSGTCNVMTGAQFRALAFSSFELTRATADSEPTGTGCLRSNAARLRNWCPTARERRQSVGGDLYGVYVEYRHQNMFPVTGTSRVIKRTAVMRLEPPPL